MSKRKKLNKKLKKTILKEKKTGYFVLPEATKKLIGGAIMILIAIIIALSFFQLSGVAGRALMTTLSFLIGKAIFAIPLIFLIGGLIFFSTKYKKFLFPVILAIFILILGISGILDYNLPLTLSPLERGGWLGYLIAFPLLKFFGPLVTNIIFGAIILISGLIFWQLLAPSFLKEKIAEREKRLEEERNPLITRIFKMPEPTFKVKEIPSPQPSISISVPGPDELKAKPSLKAMASEYESPPLELLEKEKGVPSAGDTRINSAIIKKTLENFDIPVEMSEINIGPTVTQYTFKPSEGIKLSKITALSNDLSLALAAHPIRIEAPIPGRSLVGIEVPNKERCRVRLRDLIENSQFQGATSNLTFVLGRDVAGKELFTDLARMPHLLVAGSTGTGKTIFLNSLILSLLYQNGPETLKFILIDPKRVEFPVYNELPHLLCPVIYDADQTINALKWLTKEMERRFDLMAGVKARDIIGYNELALGNKTETLPYIVLIVDELADLMAAKGREVEAGIVRLAQMARAVGIHLVVATQRPSVEVITGLIKANITSRVTFQVASQVDSRTVLDMAGAEKLLGLGDLLFVSAEIVKPRRIQGSYVSGKEVSRVVNWIKSKSKISQATSLIPELTVPPEEKEGEFTYGEEDPLYQEAKRVVIEARKASASLLQRRLRIGYARAARLIDVLEEKGVVGPGEGAKPREVYSEGNE